MIRSCSELDDREVSFCRAEHMPKRRFSMRPRSFDTIAHGGTRSLTMADRRKQRASTKDPEHEA